MPEMMRKGRGLAKVSVGGTLTPCALFDIPSTPRWMDAAIIVYGSGAVAMRYEPRR